MKNPAADEMKKENIIRKDKQRRPLIVVLHGMARLGFVVKEV